MIWRVLAGGGVALAVYAAVRPVVRDRRVALGAAALLVYDAGFLSGNPLIRELDILRSMLGRSGRFFDGAPMIMAHLRVVPPALAYPFLFAHYALVLRARLKGSRTAPSDRKSPVPRHAETPLPGFKQKVDIVAVVGEYLPVTASGSKYKAPCPFHDDHDLSMELNPDRQSYKCWTCGAGGDVFDFVMAYKRVEFREAMRMLAERAGVVLDAPSPAPTQRGISKLEIVGAAVTFGLLFHVYFYFWSAVFAGACLALVLDPKGRKLHAMVLGGGLIIGLPAVVAGSMTKAATPPDWLLRTDKFVPIGHLEGIMIPKVAIALWLLAAPAVFLRRRELTYLWCCVGAGLVCLNQQVVTGLEIENFHWMMQAGATLSLLLAALAVPWLFERAGPERRPRLWLLAAVVAVQVALGLFLRWEEGTRSLATRRAAVVYETLKADGLAVPPGAVLAGHDDVVSTVAALGEGYPLAGRLIEYSAGVTDVELDERVMLNLYLCGLDRAAARREAERPPGSLTREAQACRSEPVAREQRGRRIGLIDRIWSDPAPWVDKFGVTHVLLPADTALGDDVLKAAGPSGLVSRGKFWQLWRVEKRSTDDHH